MTGPLAPLFAQVREGLDVLYHYTSDLANPPGEGRSHSRAEALAALSAIEWHVQDMEKALTEAYDAVDRFAGEAGVTIRCDRVALPASGTPEGVAREKEEE